MKITLGNFDNWKSQIDGFVEAKRTQIADLRKQIAQELTAAFLEDIPVWSGRTARSVHWSNSGEKVLEPHPDRGDFADDGKFHYHQEFGLTSQMSLGAEPMRPSAEAIAYASIESTNFDIAEPVFLTISSTAWGKVEQGEAPTPDTARNVAVVSEIALSKIRSMFNL